MENVGIVKTDLEEGRGRNIIMTQTGNERAELKLEGQELLPGILDVVTITKIATKLPWKAFPILASVSRVWRETIRSRQIYEARVLSKSTQTLVAFIYYKNSVSKKAARFSNRRIVLYSLEDGSCDHLPPIPGVKEGIPVSCGCISMDGKVYILGGLMVPRLELARLGEKLTTVADVYVFNVAGERQWNECARMEDPRRSFGCAAKDGKIYVFGGNFNGKPVYGSEVYDPEADSWSPITPVPSLRFSHSVSLMGDELVLHGGHVYNRDHFERNPDDPQYRSMPLTHAVPAEVFHPLKNEWRLLEPFSENLVYSPLMLTVGGTFVKLTAVGLQVYNIHANSWEPSLPSGGNSEPSYFIRKPGYSFQVKPIPARAIGLDDEILAAMVWDKMDDPGVDPEEATPGGLPELYLVKSQGFGGDIKGITWEIVPCPFCPIESTMWSIQL